MVSGVLGIFQTFLSGPDLHVTAAKQLFPFRAPFARWLGLRMLAVEEKEINWHISGREGERKKWYKSSSCMSMTSKKNIKRINLEVACTTSIQAQHRLLLMLGSFRRRSFCGWSILRNIHGCFQKSGYPQIIHFNKDFHYKPSLLGYPYFWKHPHTKIGKVHFQFPSKFHQR